VTWHPDALLWGAAAAIVPYLVPPLILIAMLRRMRPRLHDWEPLPKDDSPRVSVILPARNEEANIERCVRSLLASSYPDFEVIVVDDRSTDHTALKAEKLAAHDPRCRVIRGAELPRDWYGKPWACWQGFQEATGSVLLFTDADTVHGPRLLGLAVAALETEAADMVTLMPRFEMKSFWERAVQPFFFLLLGLRFGTLRRINRNRKTRHAIANGQFILTTRDAYEFVGGHRKVQDTVIEDMMLARAYVFTGRRVLAAMADEDLRTRMYTSLADIVRGWTKNIYAGMLATVGMPFLAFFGMLFALLLPAWMLMPATALGVGIALDRQAVLAFGAVALVGAFAAIGAVLRTAKESDGWALFHPLGALVTAFILIRSTLRGTGRIVWKGRTYSQG
jgi:chlorobactene glucosyltransferase